MEEFIEQILKNLTDNGFPTKKVSLPTEKMYEIADNKGFSLNKVLDLLQEKHHIQADIQTEKIVFSLSEQGNSMFSQAQEMLKNMDPSELARVKEMVENMSPEQRDEMLKKAQSMFKSKP